MAKKIKVKAKGKEYQPQAMLDGDGNDDLAQAMKYYKTIASSCQHGGGSESYRQNVAYRGSSFDKYGALENDYITPKMAIRLAQVVYNRFGFVRHAIDTMAEFTVRDIEFHSKNKTAREVMDGWAEGIGLRTFLDQIALEYYRSGNVYIYRFESKVKDDAVRSLTEMFGLKVNASVKIPTRYTIIDPNLINFISSGLFDNRLYQIVIPASEVKVMLQQYKSNPKMFQTLPDEFAKGIQNYLGTNNGRTGDLIIELNPENLIVLYRKKQPYEPYALPFLSGAFDDLEFRQELRNMDKALARVIAKILIHVAVGDDKHTATPAALEAIRAKLSNPSTSTYLITDASVKITEYYPDVAQMLDPKKYEAVQKDIITALGISSAAYGDGGGSFSNNLLGIKILIERIIDGRSKILTNFLIPEVRRVSQLFGLKSLVVPEIVGSDLNDEKEWAKIYTRLFEDGALTPQGVIESIRNGRLPTYQQELERQPETIALKDEGYFEPILNRGGNSPDAGRPTDTTNPPQSKSKTPSPKGSKATLIRAFSHDEYTACFAETENFFKDTMQLKKFTNKHKNVIKDICTDFLVSSEYNKELLHDYLKKFKNTK